MKSFLPLLLALTACASDQDHAPLRAALDASQVSLGDTVLLAEASVQYGAGVRASLDVSSDPVFAVRTVASGTRHEIKLDLAGHVISTIAAGAGSTGCGTTISLPEALARAEAEVGGSAVAVVPDDDDPCLREIQVLVETTLWEVKLGPDGGLIEKELSDESL